LVRRQSPLVLLLVGVELLSELIASEVLR